SAHELRREPMIKRRTALQAIVAAAFVVGTGGTTALPQTAERLAPKGYDPVAYFTHPQPTPRVETHQYVFDGQRYRFASAQHRDLFKANPDKYAPQFGGSCAMNMANGVRRESDPNNWVISNGNLYVFAGQAGRDNFRQHASTAASQAAANW